MTKEQLDQLTSVEVTAYFDQRRKPLRSAVMAAAFQVYEAETAAVRASALADLLVACEAARQVDIEDRAYFAARKAREKAANVARDEARKAADAARKATERRSGSATYHFTLTPAQREAIRQAHLNPDPLPIRESRIERLVNDQRRSAGAFVRADGQTLESRLPKKVKDVTFDANLRRKES